MLWACEMTNPALKICLFSVLIVFGFATNAYASTPSLLSKHKPNEKDSILVVDENNTTLVARLADKPRTPASVIKLLTALLAIEHWGLEHQFVTNVYQQDSQIWIEGLGDPMLISEELDRFAQALSENLVQPIKVINLNSSLFADPLVPGRGTTSDPYNAPLSALAVNFNTVALRQVDNEIVSAEAQTPLTDTAVTLARTARLTEKNTRINLQNSNHAQRHFGQVVAQKLRLEVEIAINQEIPKSAELIYTHRNSNTLKTGLRGSLEYSNNFIANQ